MCEAFDKESLLLHQSEENFVRLFFISDCSLYFESLHISFRNLLFWKTLMSPVTICPCFGSGNGDAVQLQSKLFILSKMSLVTNVFINCSRLNILDRIVLANVYTVEIC